MNLKQRATDVANLLDNRRQHVMSRAQRRIWRARRGLSARTIDARIRTFEQLDAWTESMTDSKILGGVAKAVDRAAVLDTGVEDYDSRTAKDLVGLIRTLDGVDQLHRIARHETSTKDRKTVKAAVDKRLSQLEPEVVTWQPWAFSEVELDAGEGLATAQ